MDPSPTFQRRTVLAGAGTAAIGSLVALAGCGDPQEEEGPGEEGAPDQPDAHEDDGGAIDDGDDDDAEHTPTPPDDAVEEDTDAAEHPDDGDEDQADDDEDQADDDEDQADDEDQPDEE